MNQPKSILSDDAILLKQVSASSKDAFNSLYEKYWKKAYSDAYNRLRDHDAAKDIVQEIFTHIWIKRDTLIIDNLPAYLNVAVRNKVFKFVDKQKSTCPFFDILETFPATHMEADGNILWKEFLSSYESLLNKLPEKRQIIFKMRFQEDLSTKDIAVKLGLSRNTVQNQIGKAVEQLRVSLFNLLSIVMVLFAGISL